MCVSPNTRNNNSKALIPKRWGRLHERCVYEPKIYLSLQLILSSAICSSKLFFHITFDSLHPSHLWLPSTSSKIPIIPQNTLCQNKLDTMMLEFTFFISSSCDWDWSWMLEADFCKFVLIAFPCTITINKNGENYLLYSLFHYTAYSYQYIEYIKIQPLSSGTSLSQERI